MFLPSWRISPPPESPPHTSLSYPFAQMSLGPSMLLPLRLMIKLNRIKRKSYNLDGQSKTVRWTSWSWSAGGAFQEVPRVPHPVATTFFPSYVLPLLSGKHAAWISREKETDFLSVIIETSYSEWSVQSFGFTFILSFSSSFEAKCSPKNNVAPSLKIHWKFHFYSFVKLSYAGDESSSCCKQCLAVRTCLWNIYILCRM